ncbi:LysR family transcriptional regulator [Cupriavidus pinatubonensis]|uniref:LysR family transcriptional regulator n=1 Tax=Cupriavidus pinatubonensis TaxID=248026 RepID=UPI00112A2CB1|nr:LysR family transcriptional regulator [Cupriavidus pinatubonensis]TPQ42963.1 hypothetical protein C2U69_04190 [Cupriavidus pinatubonensis]
MKNSQLRAFVATAEQGTIRAAARSLALSQTAVTKALRELERDLQVPLLSRSPQGVKLNDAGLELLRRAKLILAEVDDARASIQRLCGQGTPHIHAAVTPAFSLLCLPDALQRFRSRYPEARVTIRDAFLSEMLPLLRDGTIDVAITSLMPEVLGSDLSFEPLGRVAVAMSARAGKFGTRTHRLADLGDSVWLLDSSRGGTSETVRQWFMRHQVPLPRQIIECPSSMASLVLTTNGDAIAPVPQPVLSLPWLVPLLSEIQLKEPLPTMPIGIVKRKGNVLDAPANWFVECAHLAIRSVPNLNLSP